MTAAHVVAKTEKGHDLTLTMMGSKVLEMAGYNAHTAYANGTCSGAGDFDLYPWQPLVRRDTDEDGLPRARAGDQGVANPGAGARRLRSISGPASPGHQAQLRPEASLPYHPHGLMGQSFDRDDIGVSGKQDVYTPISPELTTSALAEGAIEEASEYRLKSKFDTAFRYSRYGAKVPGGAGTDLATSVSSPARKRVTAPPEPA